MDSEKYLRKAKEENLRASNDALINRLNTERLNMIQTYESSQSTYKVMIIVFGILWVLCLFWFVGSDKYTTTSMFLFSMKTISFSYAFSIVGLIVMTFCIIISVYGFTNSKSRIKELQNCSLWDFQNNKNRYIFENKGLLGLLTKH